MADIRNAINAGKQVTTHQSNISYHGWNGSGYIIVDPTTGTGAYLIDGGANGAVILAVIGAVLLLVALTIFTGGLGTIALAGAVASGGGLFFSGVISLVLGATLYLSSLAKLVFIDEVEPKCSAGVATIGMVLALIFVPKKKIKDSVNNAGWLMAAIFSFMSYAKEAGYDIDC